MVTSVGEESPLTTHPKPSLWFVGIQEWPAAGNPQMNDIEGFGGAFCSHLEASINETVSEFTRTEDGSYPAQVPLGWSHCSLTLGSIVVRTHPFSPSRGQQGLPKPFFDLDAPPQVLSEDIYETWFWGGACHAEAPCHGGSEIQSKG